MAIEPNPYSSPRSTIVAADSPRVGDFSPQVLVLSIAIGSLVAGIAIYCIYSSDPRTGTRHGPPLWFSVAGASVVNMLAWALSGSIQRHRAIGLACSFVTGAAIVSLWIVTFGNYADVVGAAFCVGWPSGGLAASIISYALKRSSTALEPSSRKTAG